MTKAGTPNLARMFLLMKRSTFLDVILASGAKTNYEIEQNKLLCGSRMLARLSELNQEERKAVQRALKVMLKVAKNHIPMLSVFRTKSS